MPRRTLKTTSSDNTDDVAVRKGIIDRLFVPPIARSTFYKKVGEGLIVPLPHVEGYYYLNATCRALGFPRKDIKEFLAEEETENGSTILDKEQRLHLLAMAILVPELFLIYPISVFPDVVEPEEMKRVEEWVRDLRAHVEQVPDCITRMVIVGGAIIAFDQTKGGEILDVAELVASYKRSREVFFQMIAADQERRSQHTNDDPS